MTKHERRRRDLSRIISQRKQAVQWERNQQEQTALARVLDSLNAFAVLEAVQGRPPAGLLVFGPRSYYGANPAWAAVVAWYRRSGYHNYQVLNLLGVWAQGESGAPLIVVGTKSLQYTGAPYNPESYMFHLRKDFTVYYGSPAGLPSQHARLLTWAYDENTRLVARAKIEAVVNTWREQHRT